MISEDDKKYGSTIALAFITKAGTINPHLPVGENTAKDIAAIYIDEDVVDGKMAWRVRALHDFGQEKLRDVCVITAKERKDAYDYASQLAHENDKLRKLSSEPYIVVDPKRLKSAGNNDTFTKVQVNMLSANGENITSITCAGHDKEHIEEFAEMYKAFREDGNVLPKVSVTKGNLVEAEFGQQKYQKEKPPAGHRADVTPIDTFNMD